MSLVFLLLPLGGGGAAQSWPVAIPKPRADWETPLFSNPSPPALGSDWFAAASTDGIRVIELATGETVRSIRDEIRLAPVDGVPGGTRIIWSWSGALAAGEGWLASSLSSVIGAPGSNLGQHTTLSFHRLDGEPRSVVLDFKSFSPDPKVFDIQDGLCVALDRSSSPPRLRRFVLETGEELASIPVDVDLDIAPSRRAGFSDGWFWGYGEKDGIDGIHRIPLAGGPVEFVSFPGGVVSHSDLASGAGAAAAVQSTPEGDMLRIIDLDSGATLVLIDVDDPDASTSISTPLIFADGRWVLLMETGPWMQIISGTVGSPVPSGRIRFQPAAGEEWGVADSSDERILFLPPVQVPSGAFDLWTRWAALPAPERFGSISATPSCEARDALVCEVRIDPPPEWDLLLHIEASDGTAIRGEDYQSPPGHAIYPAGAEVLEIEVPLVADLEVEPNEWFRVEVRDSSGTVLWSPSSVAAVIRGASFIELAPEGVYDPGPDAGPRDIGLTGGMLVQLNYSSDRDVPAVVRRPLGGGTWEPSATWNRRPPEIGTYYRYRQSDSGLALITEDKMLHVYDPVADEVVFRLPTQASLRGQFALQNQQLATEGPEPSVISLFEIDTGTRKWSVPGYDDPIALAGDRVVRSWQQDFEAVSIDDSAQRETLFPEGLFGYAPTISGEGDFLLMVEKSPIRAGIADLSGGEPPQLLDLGEEDASIWSPKLRGGLAFLPRSMNERVWVDVYDAVDRVRIGELHRDFRVSRPEGVFDVPDSSGQPLKFYSRCFSVDGNDTLLHTFATYLSDPDSPVAGDFLSRARLQSPYPAFRSCPELREGDTDELVIRFTEAATEPLKLTIRPVDAGRPQEWSQDVSVVTLPAGETRIASGLTPRDDGWAIQDGLIPLEVRIEGSGGTENRRAAVRVRDDDLWTDEGVPINHLPFHRETAGFDGVWFGAVVPSGSATSSIQVEFDGGSALIPSPEPGAGQGDFGIQMSADDGWLAVTHRAWDPDPGLPKKSSVYVYRPLESTELLFRIAGKPMKYRFGEALLVDGDQLWIGIPGNGMSPEDGTPAGQVWEYDLQRRRKVATFKSPAGMELEYGIQMAANLENLWIWSNSDQPGASFVHQYDRATRQYLRTLSTAEGVGRSDLGAWMAATEDLLLIRSMDGEDGGPQLAAIDEAGVTRWILSELHPEAIMGDIQLVGERLLAIGGRYGIQFFELDGLAPPKALGWFEMNGRGSVLLDLSGTQLGFSDPARFPPEGFDYIDLRMLEGLRSIVGFPEGLRPASSVFEPGSPGLVVRGGRTAIMLPSDLLPERGSPLRLTKSATLSGWETAAFLDESGRWQLRGDLAADWVIERAPDALVPVGRRSKSFFRFEK